MRPRPEQGNRVSLMPGKNVVDATIWGSRETWGLQLTNTYQCRDGDWIAVKTVSTRSETETQPRNPAAKP
jgi:hypothetical protein